MRWTSQCFKADFLSRRNSFEMIDASTQWRRLNANDENKQRHIRRMFDEIIFVSRTKKRKSSIKRKKWNFVESFELFVTFRRDFDVSLVERNLKIIVSEKYQKYLIWFAEIRKIMFLSALMISTSKRDFWSSFFFFDTINANLSDISTYNYSNAMNEMSELINENEIKRANKRCKSDNASRSNDISNRVLKILVNKLISHFLNLFQICVELNYHSLCFRKTHIIALKKSKKKNYTNVKTYRSIVLLNIFDKTLKSIIAQRINDLTKTHDLLSINQMSERRNRSCETTLKLLIEQIHTV